MKPSVELKNVFIGERFATFTFKSHKLSLRGVSSASMTVGGDFVVTVQFDKETASQTKARERKNRKMIAAVMGALEYKP